MFVTSPTPSGGLPVLALRSSGSKNRHRRYVTLSDIDPALQVAPLPVNDVERALSELSLIEPYNRRVSACILGVPSE